MDDKIRAVYCWCDDLFIALGHDEEPPCDMSDAFVMTSAIVAALYFGGNYESAHCDFLNTVTSKRCFQKVVSTDGFIG
ncbi:hypothetical protein HYR99_05560 [Candidatus Poribacteria bacterium]|nr:hypothetical protein [Candidatus Poribacteria bacterium]